MAGRGGGEAPQQGGQDGSLDFIWIIASFIVGALLIWYYGKNYITVAICMTRFYEIQAIKAFLSLIIPIANFLHLPAPDLTSLKQWEHFAVTTKTAVPFDTLIGLSTAVGYYLRYPVILMLAGITSILYFFNPIQKFKQVYSMKQLRFLEQKNWPQITPIIKLDLLNTPLDEAPWAIALTPMNFCKKHQLLREDKDAKGKITGVSLIRGATFRVLSMQLGPRWYSADTLPMHLQALFAVFALRICGNKKAADNLIEQLAASASGTNKLNFAGVKELVQTYKNNKAINKVTSIHAYVTTVMASLLNASREAGVLATSEFIWLKPIDRRMWYMLNSVGRPIAVAEIAGAFAHWLAEKKLGLPLATPMVEEAVTGLDLACKDIIYKPDEE
jgi:intracellular multiplication protein IcmP